MPDARRLTYLAQAKVSEGSVLQHAEDLLHYFHHTCAPAVAGFDEYARAKWFGQVVTKVAEALLAERKMTTEECKAALLGLQCTLLKELCKKANTSLDKLPNPPMQVPSSASSGS